jgi:hypothetical protein
MGTRKTRAVPVGLERVRRRFARWRRTGEGRARIPDSLWASAVKVAEAHGICQTARTLRLDYYGLRKRVQEKAADIPAVAAPEAMTRFLELAPPVLAGSCECSVELENTGGTRMRICLRGIQAPDVATLSRTLWDVES